VHLHRVSAFTEDHVRLVRVPQAALILHLLQIFSTRYPRSTLIMSRQRAFATGAQQALRLLLEHSGQDVPGHTLARGLQRSHPADLPEPVSAFMPHTRNASSDPEIPHALYTSSTLALRVPGPAEAAVPENALKLQVGLSLPCCIDCKLRIGMPLLQLDPSSGALRSAKPMQVRA
jgi:hypothetical protein